MEVEHTGTDGSKATKGSKNSVHVVHRAVSRMHSKGDELEPYQTCYDRFKTVLPPAFIILGIVCVIATTLTSIFVQPEFKIIVRGSECTIRAGEGPAAMCPTSLRGNVSEQKCLVGLSSPVKGPELPKACSLAKSDYDVSPPEWKAYLVINCVVLAVGALVLGAPLVPVMLVTNAIFVVFKVTSEREALAGFGNPGVLALALLFVLAAAIERSGMLEPVVDVLMGDGTRPGLSRVRLVVATCIISGVINNTPLCAMLMPFVISWSIRNGLDPFDFLMPMAFATSIGGPLSRIGSPSNLVVFAQVEQKTDLGFFVAAPIGLMCVAASALYTWLCAPALLRASVRPTPMERAQKPAASLYSVRWVVMRDSVLVGSTWVGRGLQRLANTRLERIMPIRRAPDTEALDLERHVFLAGDEFIATSDAADVARLRLVQGLLIAGEAGEALRRLGAGRRERALFEVLVFDEPEGSPRASQDQTPKSPLNLASVQDTRTELLECFKAAFIACRGQEPSSTLEQKSHILLIEANASSFESAAEGQFALVRRVPRSTPPRVGRKADPIRARLTLVIACAVIFVSVIVSIPSLPFGDMWMTTAPLAALCIFAFALILMLDILTFQEAMHSINANAFVGIAASIGLGTAMENTGVSRSFALALVALAKSAGLGALGICGSFFIGACALSNVLANTAVAVLIMPIAENISREEGIDLNLLAMLVMFASTCAFSTPFGTASNLMVMQPFGPHEASYSFGDFTRFGFPLQFVLLVTILVGICILWGPIVVEGGVQAVVA